MSTPRDAAEILANERMTIDLDEGDLVTGCVLLTRVHTADGRTTLNITSSTNLSWLDELGLIVAAHDLVRQRAYESLDDDDAGEPY